MAYRLMHGVEDNDDGPPAVTAVDFLPNIDYGPTFDDALHSLLSYTVSIGHTLTKINGGLFKHLPGTEGIYCEEWRDDNKQQKSQIWLIRRLTS